MSKHPRKSLPADFELPYSELAQIYDHVMRHVDYIRWADYIQSVFTRFETTPKDVLELACGTGAMACILDDRGYRMTGIDRSESMIAVAKRKSVDTRRAIRFQVGDMVRMPVSGSFDAVLCLYDSINYVMDEADIAAMLNSLRCVLNAGGLFVFDVCTRSIRAGTSITRSTRRAKGISPTSGVASMSPRRAYRSTNSSLPSTAKGKRYSTRERHEQRIYPIARSRKSARSRVTAYSALSTVSVSKRRRRNPTGSITWSVPSNRNFHMAFDRVVGHDRQRQRLMNAVVQDRLAHGYLFCGPPGVGAEALAIELACAVNCESGPGEPCGHCRHCRRIRALQHPDLHLLVPSSSAPPPDRPSGRGEGTSGLGEGSSGRGDARQERRMGLAFQLADDPYAALPFGPNDILSVEDVRSLVKMRLPSPSKDGGRSRLSWPLTG